MYMYVCVCVNEGCRNLARLPPYIKCVPRPSQSGWIRGSQLRTPTFLDGKTLQQAQAKIVSPWSSCFGVHALNCLLPSFPCFLSLSLFLLAVFSPSIPLPLLLFLSPSLSLSLSPLLLSLSLLPPPSCTLAEVLYYSLPLSQHHKSQKLMSTLTHSLSLFFHLPSCTLAEIPYSLDPSLSQHHKSQNIYPHTHTYIHTNPIRPLCQPARLTNTAKDCTHTNCSGSQSVKTLPRIEGEQGNPP